LEEQIMSHPTLRWIVPIVAFACILSTRGLSGARVVAVPPTARGLLDFATPGDFDGDGKVDLAVKHDTGEWTIAFAANGFGSFWDATYGGYGGATAVPAPADYDGDGVTDFAVKTSDGAWCIDYAANGFHGWDVCYYGYGDASAHPVPADYDGDGIADLAVKTDSGDWYIDYAANGLGAWDVHVTGYGYANAAPVPADYDGDGKADLAVKEDSGDWYIDYAANGFGAWDVHLTGYGYATAHPVPADYDGDGVADLAVKTDSGDWYIDYAANGFGSWDVHVTGYGYANAKPVPADYDGDGQADLAVRTDDGWWLIDYASNGFGAWDWSSNPDIVALSPGAAVTGNDIQMFDSKWMNDVQRADAIGQVYTTFWPGYDYYGIPFESQAWTIGERMAAMARMYDLTHAPRYLDHLRELTNLVLAARDDHRPDAGFRMDGLRGWRVMPAWGVVRTTYGYYDHSSLVVAGVYAYPIAAFARIVAEDPALQDTYGADAKAAATGVLEMLEAFRPELHDQSLLPGHENYFVNPLSYRTMLPRARCEWAYGVALSKVPASDTTDAANAARALLDQERRDCIQSGPDSGLPGGLGGKPLAHNEYQAFVMALIELSRALDTEFYKGDLPANQRQSVDVVARQEIPAIVAGAQHFYRNRFTLQRTPDAPFRWYFLWHYRDGIDSCPPYALTCYPDDIAHAALEMRYLELLRRNQARLDALLAFSPSGPDSIDVTPLDITRLANTFLIRLVGPGPHLLEDQTGRVPSRLDRWDFACDGWLSLAAGNSYVYRACETVTLRLLDPSLYTPKTMPQVLQPQLTVGNHAGLLAWKQWRP
jgi:predicted transglutaminase-like cysteine proteinase